jgi:DNA-binding NarL/FixJ family response regulator
MHEGINVAMRPQLIRLGETQEQRQRGARPGLLYVDGQDVTRSAITVWLQRVQRTFQVVATPPGELELRLPHLVGVQMLVVNLDSGQQIWRLIESGIGPGCEGVPIVLLAHEASAAMVERGLRCGVRGLITLGMEPRIIVQALRLIHAGGSFFPVECMFRNRGAGGCPQPGRPNEGIIDVGETALEDQGPEAGQLTAREREVLRHLSRGLSNKFIGRELSISENTVKVHVAHLKRKLGIVHRFQFTLRPVPQARS